MDIVDIVIVAYWLALITYILAPPDSKPWRRIIKPRSTEVGPSTTKVLETYELLEGVLLNLSMKDLFVLQRVSTRWCDVIRRSPGLQKRMFLRGDGEVLQPSLRVRCPVIQWEEVVYDRAFRINPVIKVWDPCRHRDHGELADPFDTYRRDPVTKKYPDKILLSFPWLPKEAMSGRKDKQDMLLTQPPIAGITWRWYDDKGGWPDESLMWNPDGLTLRDLLDSTKGVYNTHIKEQGYWPKRSEIASQWEIRIKCEAEKNVPKGVCRFCEFMKATQSG